MKNLGNRGGKKNPIHPGGWLRELSSGCCRLLLTFSLYLLSFAFSWLTMTTTNACAAGLPLPQPSPFPPHPTHPLRAEGLILGPIFLTLKRLGMEKKREREEKKREKKCFKNVQKCLMFLLMKWMRWQGEQDGAGDREKKSSRSRSTFCSIADGKTCHRCSLKYQNIYSPWTDGRPTAMGSLFCVFCCFF